MLGEFHITCTQRGQHGRIELALFTRFGVGAARSLETSWDEWKPISRANTPKTPIQVGSTSQPWKFPCRRCTPRGRAAIDFAVPITDENLGRVIIGSIALDVWEFDISLYSALRN